MTTELKEWQKEHLKREMMNEIDLDETEDLRLTEEPDSKIQGLIKETFNNLRDMQGEPDVFDAFYTESGLKDYSRKDLYAEFIEAVLDRLNIHEEYEKEELKTEDVEKALFTIAEHISQEPDALTGVKEIVEEDYPELVADTSEGMSPEEYNHRYKKYIEREVERMSRGLEPKEKFTEYFQEFEALKNNDIDTVAKELNEMVDLGHDVWKLMLYSTLSAPAQTFIMGGRPTRSSLHTLLIGDISTAKSKALQIIHDISPQSEKIDGMTKASFVGSYDTSKDEITEGVVDRIINGNLIMEEYDKMDKDEGLMRTVFDNSSFTVSKGKDTKHFEEMPTSILAGANPKNDFFTTEDKALRGQVPFKEGELSRFDILIPLVNTEAQMMKYTEAMELFGSREEADLSEIRQMMNALNTKINQVENVIIGEEQEKELKEAFNQLQEELESEHRPTLIIMRDLETLSRLAFVIGCVYEEVEDGKVQITDRVVSKAVSQFEALIDLRRRLYVEDEREQLANTTKDKIFSELLQMTDTEDGKQAVEKPALKERCMQQSIVNNKQTFYNKMEELQKEERVVEMKDGETLSPDHDKRYVNVKPVV